MTQFGYALSSEQHAPNDLVRYARRAEESGFEFVLISDHYHPWIDRQGHAPFVWSVLGGIATATNRIQVGTGVTCLIMRIHPAIIAQASATVAPMMPAASSSAWAPAGVEDGHRGSDREGDLVRPGR